MTFGDFILKLSAEGRAWVAMLLPFLSAGLAGLHMPQPGYMHKKDDNKTT